MTPQQACFEQLFQAARTAMAIDLAKKFPGSDNTVVWDTRSNTVKVKVFMPKLFDTENEVLEFTMGVKTFLVSYVEETMKSLGFANNSRIRFVNID